MSTAFTRTKPTTYRAHRVQRPQEKINHALFLGGTPGIGKDTILEPVKRAVGHWNFGEATPQDMFAQFNKFQRNVILRVSEGRDLGDVDRHKLYDRMKTISAAPPDVLKINEKNLREYYVANVCAVIITSNYKTDDRRHYVAYSEPVMGDFTHAYRDDIWGWYDNEGAAHVAAFLKTLDISAFNPKAPPPKTPAFYAIVDAGRAPEIPEAMDILDKLGNPDVVTLAQLRAKAAGEFLTWIDDRKNRRALPHRLEQCGYTPVRNDLAKDGYWKIGDTRQAVYGKRTLLLAERLRGGAVA